jgi:ABC-type amino acid transport substrate-binding protein
VSIFQLAFAAPTHKTIKVGVIAEPPIAYQSKTHAWYGVIINIWQEIASDNNWPYEFIPMGENAENAIDALAKNKIDVLIGSLSVTHARITKVDFSRPFMINRIVVLERGFPLDHFGSLLFMILSKFFNYIFLVFAISFLMIAHCMWYFERKALKEFGKGYFRGILHSTWSLLMLLVGSQLVDHPKHRFTRLIILIVIFLSVIFSSLISAAFTSSLTLSLAPTVLPREKSLHELQNKTFAAVQGQTTGSTIKSLGGDIIRFPNLYDAINALKHNRKIDAIIGDADLLSYAISHSAEFNELQVTPIALDTDEYAVAFSRNSSLKTQFDYSLTQMQENNRIIPICLRYLSTSDAAACVI